GGVLNHCTAFQLLPKSHKSIPLIYSSILLEFTLSQHCNTSRRESWTGVESGKVKESTLLRTANERTILLRHTASRNSAFEAALRSFHSVISCKESTYGRY
ncbi:putative NlpD, partial [Trichinella spiralis]|uniref:putative NlpD n=1 Tax=Trichinella spiralis TaxID=6334 RepID=UPI0001EFED9B